MLKLCDIKKKYVTGELVQTALDGVTLNLRDNEFVAILGQSGSGKTTLLNVIGGLDRYDSGELIINGISTKKYKSRDWDSYRNHTIGFVFQSYNLIPHQTILSNVELAMTISGVSRSERRKRAKEALEKVGLGNQAHKRPNQMSGGQMQRVAIARALVNSPDILLADEPTGALDTQTSIQVMEMLKEVAKDRLVVMVTHNPELAEKYATRIVHLSDGKITGDSDPYEIAEDNLKPAVHKNMGRSSMSMLTALSLSFNNLRTKKGRTILTSFAGSIGIIGIALILSISTGVNNYINDIQKDTMSSYPITIDAQAFDLSSIISDSSKEKKESETPEHALDGVYSDSSQLEMQSAVTSSISKNNLTQFKKYLDDPESKIHDYVGQNGISYTYDTSFCIYAYDTDGVLINTDGSSFEDASSGSYAMSASMSAMMGEGTGSNSNFAQILSGDGSIVSDAIKDSYDVVYGTWPENYDEVVLVLNSNNEISMTALYDLGMLPSARYNNLIEQIYDGKKVSLETESFSYEDVCKQSFYLIPACNMYEKNDDGTYSLIADDTAYNGRELKMGQQNNSEKLDESSVSGTGSDNKNMEALLDSGIKLKITGVIRANNDDDSKHLISGNVGYTKLLTDYIIDYTDKSDVVSAQKADKTVNILNGMTFAPKGDAKKIEDVKKYISGMSTADKAALCKTMMQYMSADAGTGISMGMDAAGAGTETEAGTSVQVQNAQEQNAQEQMTDDQYAEYLDMYLEKADDAVLLKMYDSLISSGSYDDNMTAFGVVDKDVPSSISIYADSFEDKDGISDCIEEYNATASDGDKITYTDYVGLLMSSVTTIVNVISYVLIAFVAVSLIVSSIMIGIITYISVLERTKEIGILRAIGASKHNVSQVFNAETFIIGFQAGLIGIGVTLLLLIPGNLIIHRLTGTVNVNAALPVHDGIILIVLSIILTLIGGFIPSKKAAKRDPVTALRSE